MKELAQLLALVRMPRADSREATGALPSWRPGRHHGVRGSDVTFTHRSEYRGRRSACTDCSALAAPGGFWSPPRLGCDRGRDLSFERCLVGLHVKSARQH
jgi:hypothetical protein